MPKTAALGLALLMVSHARGVAEASDWPRFRGPNGTGVGEVSGLPGELSPATARWQLPVPFGHSSPIVVGSTVLLTALEGETLVTIAIHSRAGTERWRRSVPRLRVDAIAPESGPAVTTPVSDGSSIFAFFPEFGLVAYDLEGNERWRHPMPPFESYYGLAGSPVVEGGMLVLVCDQSRDAFIVGIDTATGREVWRQQREVTGESWTTPVVYGANTESAAILVFGTSFLDAYAPRSGERLWRVPGFGFTPVASPVVAGDRLFAVAADQGEQPMPTADEMFRSDADRDGRLTAPEMASSPFAGLFGWLDVDGDGFLGRSEYDARRDGLLSPDYGLVAVDLAATPPEILWRQRKSLPYIPTPIVYRDILFLIRDGGILTSYDPGSGQVLQQARIEGAIEPFSPSPVAADGRLYLASSDGKIATVTAQAKWQTVTVSDLDESIFASPAIGDGRLFVRTRTKLYAFGPED